MEGWEREGGGTDRLEDTAEGGEKDPTGNTIGTDGKRSCPSSVGEQRRVTPEHPSNPEGALGAPSGFRSGGVRLAPPVRPEMVPGHSPPDRAKATGVSVDQGGEQPRPRRARETRCGASSLVGDPDKELYFNKKYPIIKRIGSSTDSHPFSAFNT